jgi:hypothetical protein
LRAGNGALTTIDFPGAATTEVLAINPSGTIIGDYNFAPGFLRTSDGSYITIDIPGGACGGASAPSGGINASGAVAGSTIDPSCSVHLGYLRAPDGKITTFGVPGSLTINPLAINSANLITGYVFTDTCHGFLRMFASEMNAHGPRPPACAMASEG